MEQVVNEPFDQDQHCSPSCNSQNVNNPRSASPNVAVSQNMCSYIVVSYFGTGCMVLLAVATSAYTKKYLPPHLAILQAATPCAKKQSAQAKLYVLQTVCCDLDFLCSGFT